MSASNNGTTARCWRRSPENSQGHYLEQEITPALMLKSHGKSATQIFKKLDRRFPHGAGRLDNNWLEDEASAQQQKERKKET